VRPIVKALLAGMFVVVATFGGAAIASQVFPKGPAWTWVLIILPSLFGSLLLALYTFNARGTFATSKQLQLMNLAVAESFRAKRAFQVQEFEDEGPHYFIELEDDRVLYLNGQYIMDYEGWTDEEEGKIGPRRFPCTSFTIFRHKTEGYVSEIDCGGNVFEPELVAPAFLREEYRNKQVPRDGDVLSDKSYERIRAERLASSQ
jgi:hypothetical protein